MRQGKDLIGYELGNYKIMELIGEGGFAYVYKAWDQSLKVDVAVKVLKPQFSNDPVFERAFIKEAQTAAQLHHVNIIPIKSVGRKGDLVYFVMDYIPTTLRDLLNKKKRLSNREIAKYGKDVAKALNYAHKKGMIHKDIKPDNILIHDDDYAIVTDFGIAEAVNKYTRETGTMLVMGTPEYMSPEQARGKAVDHRSDIYSLGCMLYEMATGRPPFSGSDWYEIGRKHIEQPPIPPSYFNKELNSKLEEVILKCLEKDPNKRYQSGEEVYEALDAIHHTPTEEISPRLGIGEALSNFMRGIYTALEQIPGYVRLIFLTLFAVIIITAIYVESSKKRQPVIGGGGGGGGLGTSYSLVTKKTNSAGLSHKTSQKVKFTISASPPGCFLINLKNGDTLAYIRKSSYELFLKPDIYRFKLSKKFFADTIFEVNLASGRPVNSNIKLSRGRAFLTIKGPPGARYKIEGPNFRRSGKLPIEREPVPAGTLALMVSMGNYKPIYRTLILNHNEIKNLGNLKLYKEHGYLTIYANSNGRVYLDSTFVDILPLNAKSVESGRYTLKILWDDGSVYREKITIKPGDTSKVVFGNIRVRPLNVKKALVYLDGIEYGLASFDSPLLISHLRGFHRLKIIKKGYRPFYKTVLINMPITQEVRFKMEPLHGCISVNSFPWAEVYLNGKLVGETALFLDSVTPGKYEITVKYGKQVFDTIVVVKPEDTVTVKHNFR